MNRASWPKWSWDDRSRILGALESISSARFRPFTRLWWLNALSGTATWLCLLAVYKHLTFFPSALTHSDYGPLFAQKRAEAGHSIHETNKFLKLTQLARLTCFPILLAPQRHLLFICSKAF